jgi:hypothetical protein
VELIEDYTADVLESGIFLDHPNEDAGGHRLHADAGGGRGVPSDAIADFVAEPLAPDFRDSGRRGNGRDSARLHYEDARSSRSRVAEGFGYCRGNEARLACAGLCREDEGALVHESPRNLGKVRLYRELIRAALPS